MSFTLARWVVVVSLFFLTFGVARSSCAEESDASADLAAIKASADAFVAAFEAGDAAKIASLFTDAGEYVDGDGNVFHGRAEIQEEYEAFFAASPKNSVQLDMEVVRFVSDGLLIEEGVSTVEPIDALAATRSRYVVVHARQADGQWKIASVRSGLEQPLTPHERLEPLAWLVGDWVDESSDSVVETSWSWAEHENYLLGQFRVVTDGQVRLEGTQRIAWDPLRKRIRSWVFDAEGGFAEADWTMLDSDTWWVNSKGVTSDGEEASSTISYQRVGDDSFVWTSTNRIVAGELSPDVSVTVVRHAPPPDAP